jgi:hypothetical protein
MSLIIFIFPIVVYISQRDGPQKKYKEIFISCIYYKAQNFVKDEIS